MLSENAAYLSKGCHLLKPEEKILEWLINPKIANMYWDSGIMSSSLSTEWQYVRHTPLHHSQSWRQPSHKTKWQSLSITASVGMFRQTLQFETTVQNAFLQIFWVGCYWAPHYHLPKFDLEFYIPLHRFAFLDSHYQLQLVMRHY